MLVSVAACVEMFSLLVRVNMHASIKMVRPGYFRNKTLSKVQQRTGLIYHCTSTAEHRLSKFSRLIKIWYITHLPCN